MEDQRNAEVMYKPKRETESAKLKMGKLKREENE